MLDVSLLRTTYGQLRGGNNVFCPVSDARQSVYGIEILGSGPGGRWFKSFRPDHYFPSRFNNLRCVFNFRFRCFFTDNTDNFGELGRKCETQAHGF